MTAQSEVPVGDAGNDSAAVASTDAPALQAQNAGPTPEAGITCLDAVELPPPVSARPTGHQGAALAA